jgi:hypothetical protein
MATPGTRYSASGQNTTFGSDTHALGQVEDLANQANYLNYVPIITGTTRTAAASEFVNSAYAFSGGSTFTLTTPTAAAIVAALTNVQVGSCFEIHLYNANSGTLTLTLGSGVSAGGGWPATLATNKGFSARGIVTNATAASEAVLVYTSQFAPAL